MARSPTRPTIRLSTGRQALLRPLVDDDRERLIRAFDRLSEESRYRRFFAPIHQLEGRFLEYLTDIDHHDHEAIVATDPESGEVIGVARYVRSGAARAEAAVAVIDDWQGHGLGRALLERLVERAREEGIVRFVAVVQADNRRALELLSTIGPTTSSHRGNVVELEIELPDQGLGAPLAAALRGAASSLLGTRPLSERLARRVKQAWEGGAPVVDAPVLSDAPIVVGTDGSDTANGAVAYAAELARRLNVELHVVTAFGAGAGRAPAEQSAAPPEVARESAAPSSAEALLHRTVTRVSEGDWCPAAHAREGSPAAVLVDFAEEIGAQLIVVGNKRMTGASRLLLGSVPDRVTHRAGCSVLVVRTTAGR